MPNYTCPSCRQSFANSDDPDAPCIFCGHRLSQFVAPRPISLGRIDLAGVARGQRWMIQAVLFALAGQAYFAFGPSIVIKGWPLTFVTILPTIWLAVGVGRLVMALESKPDKAFVSGLAMFIPIVNMIVLVGLNSHAAHVLSNAGMKVGLLGVSHQRVENLLDPAKCRKCGYDLTGNMSGRCPECGTDIVR